MRKSGVISPLVTALALAATLVACAYFQVNEPLAAGAVVAAFLIVTVMNTANGLSFIFLVTPFFLCESGRPFSWMMDAFIYGFLAVWGIRRIFLGGARPPLMWPALFLAIAAAISFPVDLKEFLLSFTTWPPSHQFYMWRIGWGYHNSLRVMMNVLSGVAMFAAVWDTLKKTDGGFLADLLRSSVVLGGIYAVIGAIVMYANPMLGRPANTYLGMSLVGIWNSSLTAFAYNPQFPVHWLAPLLPVAAYFVFADRKNRPWLAAHLISAALIIYALFETGQCSSLLVTFSILAATLVTHVLIRRHEAGERLVPPAITILTGVAVCLAAVGVIWIGASISVHRVHRALEVVDGYINDPMYMTRYDVWEPRFFLWHTALKMALLHPLTGVGLGRFHPLFFDYFNSDAYDFSQVGFATGSAHSIYFQTVAEQGFLGVATWSLFVFGVYRMAFKGFPTADRRLITALSLALAAWLILGVSSDMAFIRSVGIQFWMFCAFIVYTAGDHGGSGEFPGRRMTMPLLAVFAAALAMRIGECALRPISEDFAEGFHEWEAQPDGTAARWNCGSSVMGVPIMGGGMILELSAPLPNLDKTPQVVHVDFGGEKRDVTFSDSSWKSLVFNTEGKAGETRLLKIRTEHIVNLSKIGGLDERDLGVMVKPVKWSSKSLSLNPTAAGSHAAPPRIVSSRIVSPRAVSVAPSDLPPGFIKYQERVSQPVETSCRCISKVTLYLEKIESLFMAWRKR